MIIRIDRDTKVGFRRARRKDESYEIGKTKISKKKRKEINVNFKLIQHSNSNQSFANVRLYNVASFFYRHVFYNEASL